MRPPAGSRRLPILLGLGAGIALAVLATFLFTGGGRQRSPSSGGSSVTAGPAPSSAPITSSRMVPEPRTAVQERVDAQLAQAESPKTIADLEATAVPRPAASPAFPSLPLSARTDASRWCTAFVGELLNIDYRREGRSALLSWAQLEEAPNRLPGVPPAVADKALVGSLIGAAGNSGSPVATAGQWATAALAGTTQSVSGLVMTPDRSWSELLGEGWVPADPLATVEDVTGILTSRTKAGPVTRERFSLTVMLGTARLHPGYGAVAAGNWHTTPVPD